jgi:hypothetical protein
LVGRDPAINGRAIFKKLHFDAAATLPFTPILYIYMTNHRT